MSKHALLGIAGYTDPDGDFGPWVGVSYLLKLPKMTPSSETLSHASLLISIVPIGRWTLVFISSLINFFANVLTFAHQRTGSGEYYPAPTTADADPSRVWGGRERPTTSRSQDPLRAHEGCLDISGSIPRRRVILTTTPTGPAPPDRIRGRCDYRAVTTVDTVTPPWICARANYRDRFNRSCSELNHLPPK